MIEYNDDNSDDDVDVYTIEFVWSLKDKPYICNALKKIQDSRDEEMKFTSDISKCDKIFDALLQDKMIRISHTLPSFEELK